MEKTYTSKCRILHRDGRILKLYIFQPLRNRKPGAKAPGILWIHGGGYVTGMAKMIYMSRALPLVKKYGAVVITPEYRLSWQAPYPAALLDCYEALKYLKDHARELGVDSRRIMVGGESAGGGLTAALCMYARDKGEVDIAFQMPLYPMIDDRDTPSSRDNHAPVWNTRLNHAAWNLYLRPFRDHSRNDSVPAYAAPARQKDYRGLPPAYTFVGDIEPFYCETLTYIENLRKAGVPAKVDVYPGCFHAFDMLLPFLPVSRRAIAKFEKIYRYAAKHFTARQDGSHSRRPS